MFSYNVMLEGVDNDGTGYFITLEIAAASQAEAEEVARQKATSMGLNIIGIEEVERKRQLGKSVQPGILQIYGKSYFGSEE